MAESLAPPLHKDPDIQSCRHFHPPVRCKDLGSLSKADQATEAVSPMLLALHPRHQTARPYIEQRSAKESQPAQHRVHSASVTAVLGWPLSWKTCMPKTVFFSELQEGKHDRGAPKKHYKDQLKRQLAQVGISHQSWQQEASDRDSWRSSVRKASCNFEAQRHEAATEKCKRQKE